MFKKTKTSKDYDCNEQCYCNESYKIIENYRSILDRKQKFVTSWKTLDKNGKISFIHGTRIRKETDALVIRMNHTCLIHPWYKYINVNKHLITILKQNQCYKVYEIVLLECNCLTNSHQYELAIIECPCLEQRRNYCIYCRLTFAAMDLTQVWKNVSQQTEISLPVNVFNGEVNFDESFYSQSGPCQYQRTVQIQVLHSMKGYERNLLTNSPQLSLVSHEFDEDTDNSLSENQSITLLQDDHIQHRFSDSISTISRDVINSNDDLLFYENTLTNRITRGTQTKLFAILLPQSPLSEMKSSKIAAQTLMNITRACQVNTLSYLIKSFESQTDDNSSAQHFLYNKTRLLKQSISINFSTEMNHQILNDRKQSVNVPTIEFNVGELLDNHEQNKMNSTLTNEEILPIKEDFILTLSPLKCINTCDAIDFDEPSATVTSSFDDGITSTQVVSNKSDKNSCQSTYTINLKDNNTQLKISKTNHMNTYYNTNNNSEQKLFRLKLNHYRNKKYTCGFLQRRRKRCISQSHLSKHHHNLLTTLSNTIEHDSSINSHRVNSNITPQHKAYDHTIVARASKTSLACEQLQTLLNNSDTSLKQLINSQLALTCNDNYRSVCILIDDHKQSEEYRSSFLHYIYTTLSNTLNQIFNDNSIQLTCMNLVFFQNSLCDIINMQRLRLIDTGKQILLSPPCEISLKTSDDINIAINRLSTKMPFAHQILIINFNRQRPSLSGSFLFLQLAPICSIRPTGLLTNLNSSTYSVLNLIRQLNNGQLFKQNTTKRYLLNDCSLNRLLKSYLFSSQQTMTVLTVKPKVQ